MDPVIQTCIYSDKDSGRDSWVGLMLYKKSLKMASNSRQNKQKNIEYEKTKN